MADNSDKQNDIQLNGDNDTDQTIADKERDQLDAAEEHKDADEDSQDVKSSDMANPVLSPESESERRCTSASNAGESEYESADDEELKRADSFDDATDAPKESPQEVPVVEQIDDKKSAEEQVENERKEVPEPEVNEVKNNEESVEVKADTKPVAEESEKKPEIVATDVEEPVVTNEEPVVETTDELSTEVNISQNESQVAEQINDEIKSEVISELNDDKQSKVESVELKETVEKTDEEHQPSDAPEVKLGEEVAEKRDNEDDLHDESHDDHELVDDDEYEDMESDECTDESVDRGIDRQDEELDAEERQQGDGEESNDSQLNQNDKSLDHDEDKRNPQYIPKRGPFYEHDDRAFEEGEGEPVEAEVTEDREAVPPKAVVIAKKPIETETAKKKIKKKVWGEGGDRWGHDLFREEDQAPKSKDELVNAYGYDIRNEDNPPKARRRRYYGRGPNNYTRKWEDENAYGKGRDENAIGERRERKERKERGDRPLKTDRSLAKNEMNDRLSKERSQSGSESKFDRRDEQRNHERREYDRRESFDRKDRIERTDRTERKDRDRLERNEKHRIHDKNERISERPERSYRSELRSEKSNESTHMKERFRGDRPLNDSRNQRYNYEENIERRERPFSKDDFPELPNNDLRKKLISHKTNQENWKSGQRFSTESDEQVMNEYKTEPMKIIEAIEHNNRANAHGDRSDPREPVRTLTFENSKYTQRRSSGNYELEDEKTSSGRTRNKKEMENSGRPIKKSNNANYANYGHERKDANDNYRNNRNTMRSERSDRNYPSDEPNRTVDRYYEEDYRNQRDRESNYIESNVSHQKMAIEDKSQMLNRNNESEQTRPKRYSSLRQQQRVIPENMSNLPTNTQIPTSDNHNISAHQFYESHTIQSTAFYADSPSVRPTYHPYMSPNASEAGPQSHPAGYIQPQIPQPIPPRYIPQTTATPPAPDATRYIATAVPPNVVTAPVPAPQMGQPMPAPQMGQPMPQPVPVPGAVPVPPPPQPVMPAPAPGPSGYPAGFPSFPSGYPQFPPAPPPTHVPPGYPSHVPAQQPSPHQLAELYRGGVTYYDTQSQQQNAARQVPQRRPKAAIPIVPPPDSHSGEGDGDKSYVSVNS